MKTLLAIAATALAGLAVPQTAEAGHTYSNVGYTYQSGRSSCGCPIYTKRIVTGYDCYNRPVYRYFSVPVVHRCGHSRVHTRVHYSKPCYTPSRRSYQRSYSRSYPQYSGSHHGYARRGSSGRGCR